MGVRLRRRFWVEVGFASSSGGLAVAMARFPDWIEFVSGRDPDGGNGSFEALVAIALSVVAVVLFAMAVMEWVRAAGGASARGLDRSTSQGYAVTAVDAAQSTSCLTSPGCMYHQHCEQWGLAVVACTQECEMTFEP